MASPTEGGEGGAGGGKQVVLVAVDESQGAMNALNFYLETSHNDSHHIMVLFVAEIPNVPKSKSQMDMFVDKDHFDELIQAEKAKATLLMGNMVKMLDARKIKAEVHTSFHTKPGEAIIEAAKKYKAQLIVTGSRGMGKLRKTIIGSVSDYILHHAHCPVLICRN